MHGEVFDGGGAVGLVRGHFVGLEECACGGV